MIFKTHPPKKERRSESGSILFYILIAVALLASLSYAVSQNSRSGGGTITQERTNLLASEIVEYSNILSKATTQLKLRGCDPTQISFQNNISATDYTNGADPQCQVFHISGGGVQFQDAPQGASNAAESIFFDASMEVENVGQTCAGASCADLTVIYRDLNVEVCTRINELVNVDNPADVPPADSELSFVAFQGAFTHAQTLGDEAAELDGKRAGCVQDDNTGTFNYYKVLIAR